MKRAVGLLCLFVLLAVFAGCGGNNITPIPTPKPDLIADVNPESGTLGALAFAMSNKLGVIISAGDNANQPATGVAAAKLAVAALGLDLEVRMNSMGNPPTDADYLATALQYDIVPEELFTSTAMTAEQIERFAQAVAQASENHIGFDSDSRTWTRAELTDSAEIALRVASLAYNPLAQGRGVYRYAISMGNEDAILYWTLAALGGAKADDHLADALPFVTTNDQSRPNYGTISIANEDYSAIVRELWGLTLPSYTAGLTRVEERVYLSSPVDDIVRQYPIAYRVERSGDLLRVHADILNYVTPPQYAGKAIIILKENPDTIIGWQIASIEGLSDPLPEIYEAFAPATADGYQAISLIDGNEKTVWQIGNADEETAYITLKLREPKTITGIGIYNGDHSSDTTMLRRNKRAAIVGIRFSEEAQQDDLRVDLTQNNDNPMVGFENVLLFGSEVTTDTIHLVFYGPADGHLRISDIRVF